MFKIVHVVGARPNFMKAAPVLSAIEAHGGAEQFLVHTGQHYDENMSEVFFRQLGLPRPDVNLGVGSGSHAAQTAEVMVRFEDYVLETRPDLVLVYGDVNSTVACSLVCAKLGLRVGHVEAGLRSLDRTMPEEINRLVTDQIADVLYTPSSDGDENLKREGVDPVRIVRVGNVMIDTLVRLLPDAERRWPDMSARHGVEEGGFGLVTMHRPSNVDEPDMLIAIVETLEVLAAGVSLVFPVHPRTRKKMLSLGLKLERLHIVDPVGYLDFLALQRFAKLIITDSGGVQEETTFLGVPCLTIRENTERPITVSQGTNILVGQDMQQLRHEVDEILAGRGKQGRIPALWDGKAGQRIAVDVLNGP